MKELQQAAKIEAPFVQTADDTEYKLIRTAAEAVHQGNWIVGECASRWWHQYRKGRTDGDFGEMIGMTEDQVYQRRRVWEEFGKDYHEFPRLTWSHFREALNWDSAIDILDWADNQGASVREMVAYYRATNQKPGQPSTPYEAFKDSRPAKPTTEPEPKSEKPERAPAKPQRATDDRSPVKESVTTEPPRATVQESRTVREAIHQIAGLIQFVAGHATEAERLQLLGTVKPLLAGLEARKR